MVDWIIGIIGTLLYPLFSIIFLCIDGLQAIFYAFAGIGNVSVNTGKGWFASNALQQTITSGNSGEANDTGLVFYLLNHSLVKNMIISISLLALFLLIIFTVMAFIKNAYAAKQKGWKEIVGNAIKGFGNFILLPVLCLLGVWLANILLQAINGATSSGGSTQMSRKLFIACAYNANQFRTGRNDADDWEKLKERAETYTVIGTNQKYDASYIKEGMTTEELANAVDDIYSTTNIGIWNQIEVGWYYNVGQINYLVLIVGGVFMLQALGTIAYGMIKRIFILIILYIVSPGVCALYPLDEGAAVKSWSGEVKKNVLSAHGAVAGINIFMSIIPLIDQIQIAGVVGGVAFIGDLIQIFILTVGLMCVSEFTTLLSNFIGGSDAFASSKGQITNTGKKMFQGALTGAVAGKFLYNIGSKGIKGLYNTHKERKEENKLKREADAKFTEQQHSKYKNALTDDQKSNMTEKQIKDYNKKHEAATKYFSDKRSVEDANKVLTENKQKIQHSQDMEKEARKTYGRGGYVYNLKTKSYEANEKGEAYKQKKDAAAIRKADRLAERNKKQEEKKALADEKQAIYDANGYSAAKTKRKEASRSARSDVFGVVKDLYSDSKLAGGVKKFTDVFSADSKRKKQEDAVNAAINAQLTDLNAKKLIVEQAKEKAIENNAWDKDSNAIKKDRMEAGKYNDLVRQANAGTISDADRAELKAEDNKREAIENYEKAEAEAQAVAENLKSILESAGETLKGDMKKAAEDMGKELKKSLNQNLSSPDIADKLTSHIEKLVKITKKSDEAMAESLKKLLEEMKKNTKK